MSAIGLVLAAAVAAAPTPPTEADLARAVLPAAKVARFAPRDPLPPGVARTSVELQPADGVSGAFGFLCGLKPGTEKSGAAAAHGYDPTGRFVGARVSFRFR